MTQPETTPPTVRPGAFRRLTRGALAVLALGALAGCGGWGDSTSSTPQMTITQAVSAKPDHEGGVSVTVEDGAAGWRSQPLASYFNFPGGTQLRFTVEPYTGATAEIRQSRLVVGAGITPGYVVAVTATSARDTANKASLAFRFAVGSQQGTGGEGENGRGSNSAPAIAALEDKTYDRGDAITPFDVEVSDADGDTVTVSVSGLPGGLAYSQATGRVSGTVAADAAAGDHMVTVTADDGVNDPVTATFTIQVWKMVVQTLAVAADNSRLVQTPFSVQLGRPPLNNVPQAQGVARTEYGNFPPASFNPSTRTAAQITAAWAALAVTAATTYCAAQPRGDDPDDPAYAYRAESAATGSEGWAYSSNQNTYAGTYQYYARKTRTWTATCERTVRRLDE